MSTGKQTPDSFVSSRERSNAGPIRQRKWWQLGGKDVSFVTVDEGYGAGSAGSSFTETDSTTQIDKAHTVFGDKDTAAFYKPDPSYEGAHRFDAEATWTPEEEKKLVRKLDFRICLWACIMFVALQG